MFLDWLCRLWMDQFAIALEQAALWPVISMKIVRRVLSFRRTPESIFAAHTVDSGVRQNDGQEASHHFHPFVRPE